ncbi:hypothetical protein V2A85_24610, partial [Yersinia sp. 1252 StPb PI]|uniref:hypothetical protein n=1 Tax=Yersinia sp. 1252 StPb PI TaxID=3117404 RepID=UPI003B2822CB
VILLGLSDATRSIDISYILDADVFHEETDITTNELDSISKIIDSPEISNLISNFNINGFIFDEELIKSKLSNLSISITKLINEVVFVVTDKIKNAEFDSNLIKEYNNGFKSEIEIEL